MIQTIQSNVKLSSGDIWHRLNAVLYIRPTDSFVWRAAWGMSRQSGCFGPLKAEVHAAVWSDQIQFYYSQTWSFCFDCSVVFVSDLIVSTSVPWLSFSVWEQHGEKVDFDWSIVSYLWNLQHPVSQSSLLRSPIKWEKKHMNSVLTAHTAVTSAGMRCSTYVSVDHLCKWKDFSEFVQLLPAVWM